MEPMLNYCIQIKVARAGVQHDQQQRQPRFGAGDTMSEPTLKDIAEQLSAMQREQTEIKKDLTTIKQQLEKLDSRFFEFSMRVVSANQSAFYADGKLKNDK